MKLNIVYMKLQNGDDIIGKHVSIGDDKDTHYHIEDPLQVRVHPIHGMFAKSWLLLSVETVAVISKADTLFFGEANEKAKSYYSTFLDRFASAAEETLSEEDDTEGFSSDAEAQLLAMIEADVSTKH